MFVRPGLRVGGKVDGCRHNIFEVRGHQHSYLNDFPRKAAKAAWPSDKLMLPDLYAGIISFY